MGGFHEPPNRDAYLGSVPGYVSRTEEKQSGDCTHKQLPIMRCEIWGCLYPQEGMQASVQSGEGRDANTWGSKIGV